MPIAALLWCIAGLLGTAVLAVAVGRSPAGSRVVYGLSLALSAAMCAIAAQATPASTAKVRRAARAT